MLVVPSSLSVQSTVSLDIQSAQHHTDRYVREASEGVATGQAQIWVDDEGTNSIVVIAGANAELSPEDVQAAEAAIAQATVMVVRAMDGMVITLSIRRALPIT